MDFLLRLIDGTIRAVVRLVVIIAVFLSVVVGIAVMVAKSSPPAATATVSTPAIVPRWISEDVIVKTKATLVGNLKSLTEFQFTVENKYDYPIKDIRIRCRFFGASGTEIGNTDAVVYERIPARSTRTAAQLTLSFNPQSTGHRCEAQAYFRA